MLKHVSILGLGLFMLLISTESCSLIKDKNSHNTLKVLHYNIFELDSEKIKDLTLNDPSKVSSQLGAVKESLSPYDFQLLSVNEIQYDKPGIPFNSFHSDGTNLKMLLQWLRPHHAWDLHFGMANTGAKAKKISKNSYATSNDPGARYYADPNNYGLFPGEYSTGLASRFPIKERISVRNLPWKDFNPKVNLKKYRNGAKEKLPAKLSLFDKVFMDTLIEVNHHLVHIITFHTVPAYHFGNKKTPNYQRNLDQLRFLEWYLTGKTDIPTKESYQGIHHLGPEDTYIAMGDWNTDINMDNPGSMVLRRLAKTERLFPAHSITWEAPNFNSKRVSMRLDYIYYSSDLKLENARVIRPQEKRILLGCGEQSLPAQKDSEKRTVVSYKDKSGKTCHVSINKDFKTAKDASDHFPLWAEFKFL